MESLKYFFKNLRTAFIELFSKIRQADKKFWIIFAVVIALVIAGIIGITAANQKKNSTSSDASKTALAYAQSVAKSDYLTAFSYTIAGKNGFDEYVTERYISDYDKGNDSSDESQKVINDMVIVMDKFVSSYIELNGFSDFDAFFSQYFESLYEKILTYEGEEFCTRKIMLAVIKQNLNNYKEEKESELEDKYIDEGGARIKLKKSDSLQFSEKETKTIISQKSEKANEIFESCNLKTKKIKEFSKYSYFVEINGSMVNNINVYVCRIGSSWYVDSTALVY